MDTGLRRYDEFFKIECLYDIFMLDLWCKREIKNTGFFQHFY